MHEEIQLDNRIKNSGSLAKEAFSYLNKLQTGEKIFAFYKQVFFMIA